MTKASRKIVFIDRDGVINVDLWKYVQTWKEFRFEKGALDALKMLTDKGFEIFIISNQAGVGEPGKNLKMARSRLKDLCMRAVEPRRNVADRLRRAPGITLDVPARCQAQVAERDDPGEAHAFRAA